ncbi:tetratricopeptide repeat protein [Phenylobacterium montanum]|uniref:Tetratricopeptide repeat protein n=1 Tax=Phenylobacterium montanum TaxID=2823693 RepID=A0A975G054_9CAUL|nr:tetratricopeptide repeat protein [Caulobacter sp. S6]QUD88693.1 tetratricopeptide repeat protein [Caulobacter sp. S6]
MAKKRSNSGPAIFAVAAAITLGVGGWFYWSSRASVPAQAQAAPPTLPEGRLTFAGASNIDTRYVVGDLKPGQATYQVTALIVGKTPTSVEQRYAIGVKRELVYCADRSIAQEVIALYDQAGKFSGREDLTGAAGRPIGGSDREAALACGHASPAAWRATTGWRAAVRKFQQPPADIDAEMKTQPQDAVLLAWRCRTIAEGSWRPDGRQVCDKAVGLTPDDASVRLDRGFLALKLGDTKAAARDFDAIVAKSPDCAPALFGRGLLEAMRGSAAASKADRGQALKLDPKTPDWIQETYQIGISPEYLAT